jgi:DNA-binding MarR family transcriptional regulator
MPDTENAALFEVFNEIGIIEQLSRALLEARLPSGLIAPHFNVLNHLVRLGDGRAPIDMARAFQVPKTTLTHTLKGLESQSLIEMRPNPEDARSKLVYLTAEGRHLRDKTIEALGPDFRRMAEGFDLARLADVLPVLRDLRLVLDQDKNRARARSG